MQKKILFAVNVDWFFVSHRLNLAQAALKEGYEVHLLTSFTKHKKFLTQTGIIVHDLEFDRRNTGPIKTLKSLLQIYQSLKNISPDLMHAITLKISILCFSASLPLKIKGIVLAISGLGFIYTERNMANFLKRALIIAITKIISFHPNLSLIFQNETDQRDFCKYNKNLLDQSIIINGSGVNLKKFNSSDSLKNFKVKKIVFASRLLKTKGIIEFVEAARLFNMYNAEYVRKIQFIVAGNIDNFNPASIDKLTIDSWSDIPNLATIGHVENLNELFIESYLFILPSYREGFPQVTCQAAACGLPVITTDTPGCRNTILDGETGILVPPKDSSALYHAIETLVVDETLRNKMSFKASTFARDNFNSTLIANMHLEVYGSLLGN